MEKVSIILPIYNVQKYLEQCLQTVVNQSYRDIEIILVNDGSTDNSPKVIEKYASTDERIVVVNKNNGGLMSAWIEGLKVATSPWVSFVDSDDWIELDMVEKLLNIANSNDTDIVISSYLEEHSNGNVVKQCNRLEQGSYDVEQDCGIDFCKKLINYSGGFRDRGAIITRWGKLIKRDLLLSNLSYCNTMVSYGEDVNIMLPVFFSSKRIYICNDEYLYHYRINNASILHSYTKRMKEQIDLLYSILYQYIDDKDLPKLKETLSLDYSGMIICCVKNELKRKESILKIAKYIINDMCDSVWMNVLNKSDTSGFNTFNRLIVYSLKNSNKVLLSLCCALIRGKGNI